MSAPDDEFFVGYLPTPPRTARFVAIAAGVGVLLVAALGATLAKTMGGVRGAFAETHVELEGVFEATPVPVLWVADDAVPGGVRGVIVVRGGKFGLPTSITAPIDGQAVRLGGQRIERDGRFLLELGGSPAPVELDAALRTRLDARTVERAAHVVLEGEIVDAKCWLGRMRPGDGRTHRACAQQCVGGGIPPLLVTHDAQHHAREYLLAGPHGELPNERLLPYLAEPVRVSGTLERHGDLWMLRLDPSLPQRL